MSLPDIAPAPQRITAGSQEPCRRGRRRLQASFRRAGSCTFWRLGFRQSSFRHIARISRHVIPYAWAWPPVFWHATVPFAFQIRVSHQIQRYLLSSHLCPLRGQYATALRGAVGSNRASHSGSSALDARACKILSPITGTCASYCFPFQALCGLGFDRGGELV